MIYLIFKYFLNDDIILRRIEKLKKNNIYVQILFTNIYPLTFL